MFEDRLTEEYIKHLEQTVESLSKAIEELQSVVNVAKMRQNRLLESATMDSMFPKFEGEQHGP